MSLNKQNKYNEQYAFNLYPIHHYINPCPFNVFKITNRMNKERLIFYNQEGILKINTPIVNFNKKKLDRYNNMIKDNSIVMDEYINQLCNLPISSELCNNLRLANKCYKYSKYHCGKEQIFKFELDHKNIEELQFCKSLETLFIILQQVISQFGRLNIYNGIIYNDYVNKKSLIKTLFRQNFSGEFDTEIFLIELNGNKTIIKPDISTILQILDNIYVKVQMIFTPIIFYSNGILHLKNEVLQINFFETKKFYSKKYFKKNNFRKPNTKAN